VRGVELPNTVEAWMRQDSFSNPTSLANYWEYAWILNFVFLVLLTLCVITPDPPPDQWPSDTLDNAVQKPVTLFENLPDNRVDIHPVIRFNVLMVTVLFYVHIFCTQQDMNGSFWRTRVCFQYGQILYTTWVRGPTRMHIMVHIWPYSMHIRMHIMIHNNQPEGSFNTCLWNN